MHCYRLVQIRRDCLEQERGSGDTEAKFVTDRSVLSFVAKPHCGGLLLTKFDTKECYQGSKKLRPWSDFFCHLTGLFLHFLIICVPCGDVVPCDCIYFNDMKLNSLITWWISSQTLLCVVWAQLWVDYFLRLLVIRVLTKYQLRKKSI